MHVWQTVERYLLQCLMASSSCNFKFSNSKYDNNDMTKNFNFSRKSCDDVNLKQLKVIRFDPSAHVQTLVYFAVEDVQFYKLHLESELRLPKGCFLTSWRMI